MYKIGLIGGADEIGRSMIYIEYNKTAIIVDCGMEFPDDLSVFGVNRIVSYGSYIKNNLAKVKGLFITHMHEDHIGGIRRFLEKFNVPIYAEPLTCEFLKMKHSFKDSNILIPLKSNQVLNLGPMSIRPFEVEHSTIKAFGYEIMTKIGNIVLSGDFKLGNSKEDALNNIKKWGIQKQPLALLVESTNANREGYCLHESDIIGNIEALIKKHKDDIFVISTFASNMTRLKYIIDAAQRNQQNIFVLGRNMEIAVKFLIEQEIVSSSRLNFLGDNENMSIPDNGLVLSTGCQGEPQGGLYKLIKKLDGRTNKYVLFSSSVIPGNERSVNSLKITLLKNNFKYIEGSDLYHTSGHGRQDEIKCVISTLKPKFVIPVHGDFIQQTANKDNAIDCGVEEQNVILAENNSIIKLKKDEYKIDALNDSLEYITNNGIIKESLIETKKTIAKNGLFIYSISGRFIKYSSVGIPDNCKLNRIGRTFVQHFLQEYKESVVDKKVFKAECEQFILNEMKNDNLPHIEIVLINDKVKSNKSVKSPKKTDASSSKSTKSNETEENETKGNEKIERKNRKPKLVKTKNKNKTKEKFTKKENIKNNELAATKTKLTKNK